MSSDTLISKIELQKIRSLDTGEFEIAFEEQLRNERKQSLLSVYFMKEADRRRDWAADYSSFRDYCTKKMKMSDSDFYRKHAIMKTLEELPEIESKMIDGTLNQATVSRAVQFFNREARLDQRALSKKEKRDVFDQIENLSERQVERELAILSPDIASPDRVRPPDKSFERIVDESLEVKFERLRELLAPQFRGRPSETEFLHALADIALEKLDPGQPVHTERKAKRDRVKARVASASEGLQATARVAPSASMKREDRKRCENRCAHVSLLTGEKCGSTFALELDHIVPVALGGQTSVENLRLVCRNHNQKYAVDKMGRYNVSRYLNSLR